MAICDATGPRAIAWCPPWSVVAVAWPSNVCGTPWLISTIPRITASGSRM